MEAQTEIEKDEKSKEEQIVEEKISKDVNYADERPLDTHKNALLVEEETPINKDGFFCETNDSGACSVRVALRVRPLIQHELQNGKLCVKWYPEDNQVIIGNERNFTFDKVFDMNSPQEPIYETWVKNLVLGCFSGYNATVLAYGQTGSGKTFTMGSGHTIGIDPEQLGIIPRVIGFIFNEVQKRSNKAEFIVKCSFLEIYNEEIHDLLDSSVEGSVDRYLNKGKDINIREEKNGNISIYGLQEEKVDSAEEMASWLDRGSNLRITSSTLMNNWSSRSHAIFTVAIEQHIIEDLYKPDESAKQQEANEVEEFMTAKFHFVDLAGSERAKKTGATGSTLKEGISINRGLLSLGNVISALTDETKRSLHVPYRDSKLTRILQDSLGGNSRTSMIACISPAMFNFDESLNTLKYASRARNIKNKPIVNRDPNSALIAQLRQQLYELQKDLISFKSVMMQNNIELPEEISEASKNLKKVGQVSDLSPSKNQSPSKFGYFGDKETEEENKALKQQIKEKDKTIGQLETEIKSLKDHIEDIEFDSGEAVREKDVLNLKIESLMKIFERKQINVAEEWDLIKQERKQASESEGEDESEDDDVDFINTDDMYILEEYRKKWEVLNKELQDKETRLRLLQNECDTFVKISKEDTARLEEKSEEIQRLKRNNNKLQKENVDLKRGKRNAGKPDFNPKQIRKSSTSTRQSLYVPSTQKLGISKEKRKSKDTASLLGDFEPDDTKINEIESNIFNKISESVDKIFNAQVSDSRSTFTGFKMTTNDLVVNQDNYRMTLANPKNQRRNSLDEKFMEIAELPEEEDRDTKKESIKQVENNPDRSTTFFFDEDSSGSSDGNSSVNEVTPSMQSYSMKVRDNEGAVPSTGPKESEPKQQEPVEDTKQEDSKKDEKIDTENKEDIEEDEAKLVEFQQQEQKLIEEINTLSNEVEQNNEDEEEKQEDETEMDITQTENPDSITDSQIIESHFLSEATEEDKIEDIKMQNELFSRQKAVDEMDGEMLKKQEILDAIIESNKEMKKSIVDAMKQEYLKKIISLQNEIKKLEGLKERDLKKAKSESVKTSVSNEYKVKIRQMEKELKIFKKKDKEQVDKLRVSKQQTEKIKSLKHEIDNMKAQKVKMQRQIKEEQERHRKWKNEKTKTIMKMKRANQK